MVFHDLRAVEPHRAIGRLVHAGDDIERGGFACAVGADEGHDLTLVDLQIQIVHGDDAAELHGNVIQSQQILTHDCAASFFSFFARFLKRSGSSLSPMMPFRKNSTTTMMITENTAMRKPFLNTAGAVMPRNVPASRPRSSHSEQEDIQEACQHGAGDGTDAADDHDQQDLIGHGCS